MMGRQDRDQGQVGLSGGECIARADAGPALTAVARHGSKLDLADQMCQPEGSRRGQSAN
jgi:hypothetical protein